MAQPLTRGHTAQFVLLRLLHPLLHVGLSFDIIPFLIYSVIFFFFQDTFDIRILMAKSVKYTVNFLEAKEEDLYKYVSPKCLIVLQLNTSFWYMGKVQKEVCKDGHIFIYNFLAFSRIEIPFKFHMMHSGLVHGLAFWFDVAFIGSM